MAWASTPSEARRDDRVLQGRAILLLEGDIELLDREFLVKTLFLIRHR